MLSPFVDLGSAQVRLRVLSVGAGPPLVMLHGVSLAAAVWAPWLADLAGYRALLVKLPGSVMSGGELGQITAPTMFCWGTRAGPSRHRQDSGSSAS